MQNTIKLNAIIDELAQNPDSTRLAGAMGSYPRKWEHNVTLYFSRVADALNIAI